MAEFSKDTKIAKWWRLNLRLFQSTHSARSRFMLSWATSASTFVFLSITTGLYESRSGFRFVPARAGIFFAIRSRPEV